MNVVATGDNKSVPDPATWKLSPGDRPPLAFGMHTILERGTYTNCWLYSRAADAKYVHYCDNETIQGVEFKVPPKPTL